MKSVFEKAIEKGTRMHSDDFIDAMTYVYGIWPSSSKNPNRLVDLNLRITKVIFNEPATIILWNDGSKTIVKCNKDDIFDREKGMAMAICKKILGEKFRETFKKYLPEEEKVQIPLMTTEELINRLKEMNNNLSFKFKCDGESDEE